MVFDSIPFLIFMPVVFVLYWSLRRGPQNGVLLLASYIFYGWWDWRFLCLIAASSAVDYVAGLAISRGSNPRAWLAASVGVNIGSLVVFKYLDFGIASMARILTTVGFEPHLETLGLILPVGISFYTFQTLSYTIDVYRREIKATQDVVAFFAFVGFFPQLVAGPIERARSLLPQFQRERKFNTPVSGDACLQILYGFLLKVVVADNLAVVVQQGFDYNATPSGGTVLLSTYAFAFQIYGDFAGYSHIAIGCAQLFGFSLTRNFAYPYFSRSPAEFWTRWHISLSTWFRDYVYIPLGGNRGGPKRRWLNVLVTFITSGLWHGAGFQFAAWGMYHGLLVAGQRRRDRSGRLDQPLGGSDSKLRSLFSVIATFHLICVGWVFFRSAGLFHDGELLRTLLVGWTEIPRLNNQLSWIPVVVSDRVATEKTAAWPPSQGGLQHGALGHRSCIDSGYYRLRTGSGSYRSSTSSSEGRSVPIQMEPFRAGLKAAALVCVVLVGLAGVDRVMHRLPARWTMFAHDAPRDVERLRSSHGKVLYFGDSVLSFVTRDEEDQATLPGIVADAFGQPLVDVSQRANAVDTFRTQIDYLLRAGVRPSLAVIPINLRSFAPEWASDPSWNFAMRQRMYDHLFLTRALAVFNWSFDRAEHGPPAEVAVHIGDRYMGSVEDFLEPEVQDDPPDSLIHNRYLARYGSELEGTERFKVLRELVTLVRKQEIPALFYLVPFDWESVERFVAADERAPIRANVETLRETLRQADVEWLDLTDLLATADFDYGRGNPNEHLRASGRHRCAAVLAESILRLL